jgi:NitT/TauT family transport system substrate-binding protein
MPITLEYGVPTDKCGLQLLLGIAKGFFREEGLDLSVKVVYGGPEIAAAYDSGRLKIGELGTPPCLTALSNGHRFKIVGSGVRRGAVQHLVIRPDLEHWKDLRGRRLAALTIGSCSYWFLRALLKKHDVDPDKDLEIIGLGDRYPQVVELLANGKIDGAVIAEPNVTIAESAGLCCVWVSLASVDFLPRLQWTVCVANLDVIEHEPALVEAVLRGCRRSYRYAAENPEEWVRLGARHFGIGEEIMTRAIEREIGDLHFDCEIDVDGLKAAIEFQESLGSLARPIALDDIVDFKFQKLFMEPILISPH